MTKLTSKEITAIEFLRAEAAEGEAQAWTTSKELGEQLNLTTRAAGGVLGALWRKKLVDTQMGGFAAEKTTRTFWLTEAGATVVLGSKEVEAPAPKKAPTKAKKAPAKKAAPKKAPAKKSGKAARVWTATGKDGRTVEFSTDNLTDIAVPTSKGDVLYTFETVGKAKEFFKAAEFKIS